MTDVVDIRRDNLRRYARDRDGVIALSRELGYHNASTLFQMIGPNPLRGITYDRARTFEQRLGLGAGALDVADRDPRESAPTSPAAVEPFEQTGRATRQAMVVACPYCGAAALQPCRTAAGASASIHVQRAHELAALARRGLRRAQELIAVLPQPVRRGFAAMPEAKRKEIAKKGGRTSAANGTGHRWTSDEASQASLSRRGRPRR